MEFSVSNKIRRDMNENELNFRALVKKHGAKNLACVLYTDVHDLEEELDRTTHLLKQCCKNKTCRHDA